MTQRIKEHFVDCSEKGGFCFSLTCTVCGKVWKSSIVKPEVSTAAKRLYQNEYNRAREAAYLEALTEAERELLALCISAGTYGTTERLVENSLKKMNGENKITLSNRLTYLRKRLFADKSIYLVLYSKLAKHKWMLPFCVIHRMFRGLFTARKRLWGEMKSIWKVK